MDMKHGVKKQLLQKLKEAMKEEDGKEMESKLGDKMKGMKQVKVMSDSEEGLEKGLSMAQKIMAKKMEMEEEEGEEEEC